MNSIFIAIVVCIVALLSAVLAFRQPPKKRRQIVIIGKKGTGKTRLFLALSNKNKEGIRTIPSVDPSKELLGRAAVLVDLPGADSFESLKDTWTLSSRDLIIYMFNKKEDENPKGVDASIPIYKIYTGKDEPWSHAIKCMCMEGLLKADLGSSEIQSVLSKIL
ncbi:hypothetical protein NERG_01711 [Nematocida ausubeli]|uniref:Signal recognition particle receptor subunit beta n=1 Tax=Nematocida ausubeli (strain ATCC PRA-371 / ERTm2) TaxID=1913371 RepID=H8ZDP0_NEMA1|nr:hypothetical protein NERG_01711 [Nematocida ausubeli]